MITKPWIFELVDLVCACTTSTSQKLKRILVSLMETKNSSIQVHHACTRLQRLLSWQTNKRGPYPKPLFQVAPTWSQTTLYNSPEPFKAAVVKQNDPASWFGFLNLLIFLSCQKSDMSQSLILIPYLFLSSGLWGLAISHHMGCCWQKRGIFCWHRAQSGHLHLSSGASPSCWHWTHSWVFHSFHWRR